MDRKNGDIEAKANFSTSNGREASNHVISNTNTDPDTIATTSLENVTTTARHDPAVVIIADDLTGACDTSMKFASQGLSSFVYLPTAGDYDRNMCSSSVVAFVTETRDLTRETAMCSSLQIFEKIKALQFNPTVWYQKVDSTMRGNIGIDLLNFMTSMNLSRCIFAPAFPEPGRVTIGGFHFLHGNPISLADEQFSRVATSDIRVLLKNQEPRLVLKLIGIDTIKAGATAIFRNMKQSPDSEVRERIVYVCDAISAYDLKEIVKTASLFFTEEKETVLLCGSAGLAQHVPSVFRLPSLTYVSPVVSAFASNFLVAIGSEEPHTRKQVEYALSILKSQEVIVRNGTNPDEVVDRLARWLLKKKGKGHCRKSCGIFLRIGDDCERGQLSSHIDKIAQCSRLIMDEAKSYLCGLFCSGGWMASVLARKLEACGLQITNILVEGSVPICALRGGPFEGHLLITKGGTLGERTVIVDSVRQMQDACCCEPGKPILAVTMGDPCGVGPEIVAKAFCNPAIFQVCKPFVIGHESYLLPFLLSSHGRPVTIMPISRPEDALFEYGTICVLRPSKLDYSDKIRPGIVCPTGGLAAVLCVHSAADLSLNGSVHGIVTAPLNKEAMNEAGFFFSGHTELLGERTATKNYRMLLASRAMRVVHVTTHVSLASVSSLLSVERIFDTITLGGDAVIDLGFSNPKIGVAGLNPHSGENGLFGTEEIEFIEPAIRMAKEKGWDVEGPVPPDTLFLKASKREFDLVVAMYHDQGHIPIKLLAFSDAVNITLGLPIVRTSVDHGTAFDIAGKGIADSANLIEAIFMGSKLAQARKTI